MAYDLESWVPVLEQPARQWGHPEAMLSPGLLVGHSNRKLLRRVPLRQLPTRYANNSNGIPSDVAGSYRRKDDKALEQLKVNESLVHNVVSPFWTGPLRSPERLQHTFAQESVHGRSGRPRQGRSRRVSLATFERFSAEAMR